MNFSLKQIFDRFTTDEFPPKFVMGSLEDGTVVSIKTKDIPDVLTRYSCGGTTPVHAGSLPILVPIV